jgi:hypothetical protein
MRECEDRSIKIDDDRLARTNIFGVNFRQDFSISFGLVKRLHLRRPTAPFHIHSPLRTWQPGPPPT